VQAREYEKARALGPTREVGPAQAAMVSAAPSPS
jgi:hypothetical protein